MNATKVNAALNLSLPEDQLESVLYHSSFQPLSPVIRSKNKAFTILGSAIIEAAYSFFLYQNDIAEDYKEYALLIIISKVTGAPFGKSSPNFK